jgi:L-cysteine S-thiosulfotransferase
MTKKLILLPLATAAAVMLAACASGPETPDPKAGAALDAEANRLIAAAFREQGIAKVDRIRQDLGQSACSSEKPPTEEVANQVMAEAKAGVKWPTGGQYIGDWREGERIAQSGRGLTWTDSSTATSANGGSCYNCHQISKDEVSFGTIGPSLYNYGKNRGVRDILAPTSQPIIEYTWMKIWNSKSYAACSNMPRFGHMGILDEKQIAHVMALILDPRSPVNQ